MAKATPDPLLAEGERLLGEWGLGSDATAADLSAVAHRSAAADLAISHRLGRVVAVESAEALQRLAHDTADKRVRKEAKRALYRLQQRGVVVPELPQAPAPAPVIAPALEGYVSPVDGRGDQLVWLVKAQPGGVAHLFAVINDPEGLRETALTSLTRKALKSLREELERKHELRLVEVDWRFADFLMQRAFEWARTRGTRMAGDFPGSRAQLTAQPPATAPPPNPQLPTLDGDAGSTALAESGQLLTEPEFRTWFLSPEDLKADLDELTSAQDSPLVLNRVQQEERFEGVILKAIDRICGGANRAPWARRLSAMSWYFAASRRRIPAARALAASRALEGDRPVHEVPFCAALVRASLAFFFERAVEQQQEREKSSLVLTPQQVAARRERP